MRSSQHDVAAAPRAGTPAAERVSRQRKPVRAGDALLRLQRLHGNRYVQRLLESRSASGLAPRTRDRLERAFDTDLSSVRVEHRPEVAAIGARAYTRGERISVAPSQRLDTAAGQELLTHEVAHVVQQRQGRVRPQVQFGAVGFNLDAGLETEADTVARRVSSGRPAGMAAAESRATGAVAQGKFGFEFETNNSFIAHGDAKIVGEKELAYEDKAAGFRIEGDEGTDPAHFDVEFITDATAKPDVAIGSAAAAAALATDLAGRATSSTEVSPDGHPVVIAEGKDKGGTWTRKVAIEVEDPTFFASTQGSVGVGFERIPDLIRANLNKGEASDVEQSVSRLAAADPHVSGGSPALTGFLHALVFFVGRAAMPNDRKVNPPLNNHNWLLLPGEHEWQEIVTDGPKANFSIMARTDFHSMFTALPDLDQQAFQAMVTTPGHRAENSALAKVLGRLRLGNRLFVDPYRVDKDLPLTPEDKKRLKIVQAEENGARATVAVATSGPSILDWLLSVIDGRSYHGGKPIGSPRDSSKKDMASAPLGWGTVSADVGFRPTNEQILNQHIYAMGAYRMDLEGVSPLAVFELRNLGQNLASLGYPTTANGWEQAVRLALKLYLAAGVV
jgi:hypothetical protein